MSLASCTLGNVCEAAEHLKLCTCTAANLREPDWVLERRDLQRQEVFRRGRAMQPRFHPGEQACVDALRQALMAGDCFDFDYVPQEGDVLRLRVHLQPGAKQRREVRFRFLAGQWTHDLSRSLVSWRTQMVEAERGRLG